MAEKSNNRWIYAVTAAIFLFAAIVNTWMILDEGITLLKMIAVFALFLGAILLLVVFKRAGSAGN